MMEKFVWVDMDNQVHEFDPNSGEGPLLEGAASHDLCDASESSERRGDSGVVRAKLDGGVWRFVARLTYDERKKLNLWRSREEREAWKAEG